MEGYFVKQATKLVYQWAQVSVDSPIEFIDPIATAMKLVILSYKTTGTKLSIKNNKIEIQESWMLQGIERWYNDDTKSQIYQLKLPLFYFRGIVLNHIPLHHLIMNQDVFDLMNRLAFQGLKKLKLTYNCKNGSLVDNCIDQYLSILSTPYTLEDYQREMEKFNKPTLFAVYYEYTKLWCQDDFLMLYQLLTITQQEYNMIIQNKLADCIDCYIQSKDMKIDNIRPDMK